MRRCLMLATLALLAMVTAACNGSDDHAAESSPPRLKGDCRPQEVAAARQQLLDHDAEIRRQGARYFANNILDDGDLHMDIIALLDAPEPEVRLEAATTLRQPGYHRASEALRYVLLNDRDHKVRAAAAMGLFTHTGDTELEFWCRLMRDTYTAPEVQTAVADILSTIDTRPAARAICDRFGRTGDQRSEVEENLLSALARMSRSAAQDEFLRVIRSRGIEVSMTAVVGDGPLGDTNMATMVAMYRRLACPPGQSPKYTAGAF